MPVHSCGTLQCIGVHGEGIQCVGGHFAEEVHAKYVIQIHPACRAEQYSTVQYSTLQCSTVECSAVECSAGGISLLAPIANISPSCKC